MKATPLLFMADYRRNMKADVLPNYFLIIRLGNTSYSVMKFKTYQDADDWVTLNKTGLFPGAKTEIVDEYEFSDRITDIEAELEFTDITKELPEMSACLN